MLLVRVSTGRLSLSSATAGYRPSGVCTQYDAANRARRSAAQARSPAGFRTAAVPADGAPADGASADGAPADCAPADGACTDAASVDPPAVDPPAVDPTTEAASGPNASSRSAPASAASYA